ncbi:protein of unknown function [Candidatus Promineifilum breve]|uniref:Uncharacterized protein n=1 Tax=Candidatus Promineifilum breve TaxID=1806508 RepID=A0A170PEF1_9CHLR|nr:protein of unknown function [Candidatus Promineifilum breve]
MTGAAHSPLFTLIVWSLPFLLIKLDGKGRYFFQECIVDQGQRLTMVTTPMKSGRGAR